MISANLEVIWAMSVHSLRHRVEQDPVVLQRPPSYDDRRYLGRRRYMRRFEIRADTLPALPVMMLVTVEALKDLGGSATIQELDEKVIEQNFV